jgi:hypothetical protein
MKFPFSTFLLPFLAISTLAFAEPTLHTKTYQTESSGSLYLSTLGATYYTFNKPTSISFFYQSAVKVSGYVTAEIKDGTTKVVRTKSESANPAFLSFYNFSQRKVNGKTRVFARVLTQNTSTVQPWSDKYVYKRPVDVTNWRISIRYTKTGEISKDLRDQVQTAIAQYNDFFSKHPEYTPEQQQDVLSALKLWTNAQLLIQTVNGK